MYYEKMMKKKKKKKKKKEEEEEEISLQVPVHGTNLECYVENRILFKPRRE